MSSDEELALRVLKGRPAPDGVVANLRRMSALPEAARGRFWQALAPVLKEPIPGDVDPVLDQFCARYGVAKAVLAAPLGAARYLVRATSLNDATEDDFVADVTQITGDEALAVTLVAGLGAAREVIRAEAKAATLVEHGNVFAGVDWRVELITSSSRGGALALPVAVLTFRYHEGHDQKRLTLQFPAESLAELRQVCDRILA